jgi:hypothetical protein
MSRLYLPKGIAAIALSLEMSEMAKDETNIRA